MCIHTLHTPSTAKNPGIQLTHLPVPFSQAMHCGPAAHCGTGAGKRRLEQPTMISNWHTHTHPPRRGLPPAERRHPPCCRFCRLGLCNNPGHSAMRRKGVLGWLKVGRAGSRGRQLAGWQAGRPASAAHLLAVGTLHVVRRITRIAARHRTLLAHPADGRVPCSAVPAPASLVLAFHAVLSLALQSCGGCSMACHGGLSCRAVLRCECARAGSAVYRLPECNRLPATNLHPASPQVCSHQATHCCCNLSHLDARAAILAQPVAARATLALH